MCGRYASTVSRATLLEPFQISPELADEELARTTTRRRQEAPIVLARKPRDAPNDADPQRQLRDLTWGSVPFWAKDPRIGARMNNARAEALHEKPSHRAAFKPRRCLIPRLGSTSGSRPTK